DPVPVRLAERRGRSLSRLDAHRVRIAPGEVQVPPFRREADEELCLVLRQIRQLVAGLHRAPLLEAAREARAELGVRVRVRELDRNGEPARELELILARELETAHPHLAAGELLAEVAAAAGRRRARADEIVVIVVEADQLGSAVAAREPRARLVVRALLGLGRAAGARAVEAFVHAAEQRPRLAEAVDRAEARNDLVVFGADDGGRPGGPRGIAAGPAARREIDALVAHARRQDEVAERGLVVE